MNKSVSLRFSQSASTYEQHSSLQKRIADYVSAKASLVENVDSLMEIGCGTGFLTLKLASNFTDKKLTALDISPEMLNVAQKKLQGKNIEWLCGDYLHFDLSRKFNLIVSSSALHWMQPLTLAFSNLVSHLKDNGYVVFSIMLNGTFKELQKARNKIAPDKSPAIDLPMEENVINALLINGFEVTEHELDIVTIQYKDCEDFLKSIHEQGVTGSTNVSSLLNRRELKNLVNYYNNTFKNKLGKIYATYEILYITARKGEFK